jgi:hypothetical protein
MLYVYLIELYKLMNIIGDLIGRERENLFLNNLVELKFN